MATPQDVARKIREMAAGKATFEDVKALAAETVFTRSRPQVYGQEPYWDPESFDTVIDANYNLTQPQVRELFAVAKFK